MKKASKLLYVLLALLLAASFGILGCGGDDDPPPPPVADGWAWAWFEYTTADISDPYLTTVNYHAGNDGTDDLVIIHKVIVNTSKSEAGATTIMDYSTKTIGSGVDDYDSMNRVKNGYYELSGVGTAYTYGGGFGYPGLKDYSVIGFLIKTEGVTLGNARVELGGKDPPQLVQNVKTFASLIK